MININNKTNDFILHTLYGILIGASMLIPGLSGGTTAILLGVYDHILQSANCLAKNFKSNLFFLFPFAIGSLVGVFLIAFPLNFLFGKYNFIISYFLIGLILSGSISFLPKKDMPFQQIILLVFSGMASVIIINVLPKQPFSTYNGFFIAPIIGFLCSIAIILPGISLTNVLILFNYYDILLDSIVKLDIENILLFTIFILIGIKVTINFLTNEYKKRKDEINCILFGMILASISQIYQGPPDKNTLLISILLFLLGFFISGVFVLKK